MEEWKIGFDSNIYQNVPWEMTRFILKDRIENPEDLKSFSWEGFEFNESLSNEKKFVFTNGKEI